ncbi:MAG TPA: NUDIX hydrolase [Bacteroidia bacterium]|jgi:ADP-ribose pyrophosphatase YjhB (NUDIX family)|nr:NUDIX hydrolase [Bacteroidia bacterium]
MNIKQFNIRVYGILMNNKNQVLVTDELIQGNRITKFPGGGLEFGEGTIDCLKREFMEEAKTNIEVIEHFYTTDFFQPSAFHTDHQIISIYYIVKPISTIEIPVKDEEIDFQGKDKFEQHFRWLALNSISEANFTLPIDKTVGGMLEEKFKNKKQN